MLPIFVGLAVWAVLMAVVVTVALFLFRPLRRFAGFVLFTPTMAITGALVGFAAVGWLLDGRLRPEVATSIAFYLGFLLCGAAGSVAGVVAGFFVWRRLRRPA
jgi:hypothetical protein